MKPRHQTLQHITKDLHYFNAYAVLDRINLSDLSDEQPQKNMASFDASLIIPSTDDFVALSKGFAVIVARILSQYINAFKDISHLTRKHIVHSRSAEMSQKSKVVRLIIAEYIL